MQPSDVISYYSKQIPFLDSIAIKLRSSSIPMHDKVTMLKAVHSSTQQYILQLQRNPSFHGTKILAHLVELSSLCVISLPVLSQAQMRIIPDSLLAMKQKLEGDLKVMIVSVQLSLTPFQLSLGCAGLRNDVSSVSEYMSGNCRKILTSALDFKMLVARFKSDPYVVLKPLVQSIRIIGKNYPADISMCVDDYFDLLLRLDAGAFPTTGSIVSKGILEYIPDNFSDLGSDPTLDAGVRDREKIKVIKRTIFNQSRALFISQFLAPEMNIVALVNSVSYFVNKNMPYDGVSFGKKLRGSIPVHFGFLPASPLAVCRHHALYAAVILQAFGLETRLLKCMMVWSEREASRREPHVANLVKLGSSWFLLDVTNYSRVGGQIQMRLVDVHLPSVNLNARTYTFPVDTDAGRTEYTTRNNAYYRIR